MSAVMGSQWTVPLLNVVHLYNSLILNPPSSIFHKPPRLAGSKALKYTCKDSWAFSEMSGGRESLENTGSPLARGSGKADIQPVCTRLVKIKMFNDHQTVGQWLLLRDLPSEGP